MADAPQPVPAHAMFKALAALAALAELGEATAAPRCRRRWAGRGGLLRVVGFHGRLYPQSITVPSLP